MTYKLSIAQYNMIDVFVRQWGASNLLISPKRTKKQVTIGFKCFEPNSTYNKTYPCFWLPGETTAQELQEVIDAVDEHLNRVLDKVH